MDENSAYTECELTRTDFEALLAVTSAMELVLLTQEIDKQIVDILSRKVLGTSDEAVAREMLVTRVAELSERVREIGRL